MGFKGTKGDWHALYFGGVTCIHTEPFYEGDNVLSQDDTALEEVEANAKLICASQDLLSALIKLKDQFSGLTTTEAIEQALKQAEEAIDKALK